MNDGRERILTQACYESVLQAMSKFAQKKPEELLLAFYL